MNRPHPNGFDRWAAVYDPICRIALGGVVQRATCSFLTTLPYHGTLAIVGAGTGWYLPTLRALRPALTLLIVDSSRAMIQSCESVCRQHQIEASTLLHGDAFDILRARHHDYVLSCFFVDMFTTNTLITQLSTLPAQRWMVLDFAVPSSGFVRRAYARLMLATMYTTFRATCAIEASSLPDIAHAFHACNYRTDSHHLYAGGFVQGSHFIPTNAPRTHDPLTP